MPGIDAAETLAVPIWLAGAAAVAFVVAILLAVKRAGGVALITSLFRICLAVALGFMAAAATPANAALSMIARWC